MKDPPLDWGDPETFRPARFAEPDAPKLLSFGSGPHYSYQWDREAKRHHADPRRFEFHTYQKETQLWWNYLRSGERKFYNWAFPSEDHWVDIATTHVPLQYQCDWRGGFRRGPADLAPHPGRWDGLTPLTGPVRGLRARRRSPRGTRGTPR